MKYMGSKSRIAKHIIPLILKNFNNDSVIYDPFCGGGNFIDKLSSYPNRKVASDINKYVIEALKLIRDNPTSLPKNNKEFTEDDYKKVKNGELEVSDGLYGYIAFALSYGGKWFGGWRRCEKSKRGEYDYVTGSYNSALKQSKLIQNIDFIHSSYDELEIEDGSIVYCDPPYDKSTKYKANKNDFDHGKFWDWCRLQSKLGNEIFISEYSAPDDFVSIWEKEIPSSLDKDTGSKRGTEKLFIHKSLL